MLFTEEETIIMQAAADPQRGGMGAFTSYWFSPEKGIARDDLAGKPPDEYDPPLQPGEYVPWIPLPWQMLLAHDTRREITVIGAFGSSKTVGLAAISCYYALMMPDFRFMDVAPRAWQAKQMFDAVRRDLIHWKEDPDNPRRIERLVKRITRAPWPAIEFKNGSTLEFMSADRNAEGIRSWSGDMAVIDEAGLMNEDDTEDLMVNLGSRLRGFSGTRERLGKLVVMGNADESAYLWDRFDLGIDESPLKDKYLSILLTIDDNPYVTKQQKQDIERRIVDPGKRDQYLYSKRPLPHGKEFTPALIEGASSPDLDDAMKNGLDNKLNGYVKITSGKGLTLTWKLPYVEGHTYILVGDPGQGTPPKRNSGVLTVFDATGFPDTPATLAAFDWVDGKGSYWPWVYSLEVLQGQYKPLFTGFDSTGPQKGFDELVFVQRGISAEGINFAGNKMQMVAALKLLMGNGKILMPERDIPHIWTQLSRWRMPDKRINQDIASALFMAAHIIHRLFWYAKEGEEWEELPDIMLLKRSGVRSGRQRAHRRRL